MRQFHILYRFFDMSDQLLYVGITNHISHRMSQHENDKHWWDEVSKATFQHYPDRVSLDSAERRAIALEKPLYNIQHAKPGRSLEDRIKELEKKLSEVQTKSSSVKSVEQMPMMLTTRSLAACLGIGESRIASLRKGGIGPKCKQVGKRWIYERQDVLNYLDQNGLSWLYERVSA